MRPRPKSEPSLFARMRALAETGHSRAQELREKADEFETRAKAYFQKHKNASLEETDILMRSFMRSWTEARLCFDECTRPDPNLPANWT